MIKIVNYSGFSTSLFFITGLALVFTLFVAVPQARAESPNILVDRNMTIGSEGRGVVVLQGLLSELGYLNIPINIPLGYFGPLTRAAVAKYQASQQVLPAVGYFGPLTKVAMHKQFATRGWLTLLGW